MSSTNQFKLALHSALLVAIILNAGCTSAQLRRQHNLQLQEVTELQYNQVLSNLAMIKSGQGKVPHFALLGSATTQLLNGNTLNGGLNWNPTTLTSETLGLNGTRNLSEQFSATPITDAGKLRRISCALELATVGYGIEVVEVEQEDPETKTLQRFFEVAPTQGCVNCIRELVAVGTLPSPSAGVEIRRGSMIFKTEHDALEYQASLLEALRCKVPTCWFGFGKKRDIPRDALYVGRFGRCYCWVDCERIEELSRFTLTLLEISVKEPSVASVELRRVFNTPNGLIEIKGTARGEIGDFVSPKEIAVWRDADIAKATSAPEFSAEAKGSLESIDMQLPNEFEPLPSQREAPLILVPQGLMVTPSTNQ